MGKIKTSKTKRAKKSEVTNKPTYERKDIDLGGGKKIKVEEWKGELRFDIRSWAPGSCNAPYPTKKGVSLNARRFKTLCEFSGDINVALGSYSQEQFRLGCHIYASVTPYGVDLRKFFVPKQNHQLLLPSKYGVFLKRSEWTELDKQLPEIVRTCPIIADVVTCRTDPEHAQPHVALGCTECSVIPFDLPLSMS